MEYYSPLPNLIASLQKHIPTNELKSIEQAANECLEHQATIAVFINTFACYCDFREVKDAGHMLAQINIAMTETNNSLFDLKNSTNCRAKFANRAKLTTVPIDKANGGAE
jgi:hypothetical protein